MPDNQILIWVASIVGFTVLTLVSVIGWFWSRDRKSIDNKFQVTDAKFEKMVEDTDQKFDKVHAEIKEQGQAIHKVALDIAENMKRRK